LQAEKESKASKQSTLLAFFTISNKTLIFLRSIQYSICAKKTWEREREGRERREEREKKTWPPV
jgi:hypothetical protein